jgi:hypothetical protein
MTVVAQARRQRSDLGSIASAIGLVSGSVLMMARVFTDELRPPSEWWEDASFAAILLGPFVLSLIARRFEPSFRAGVLVGAGVLTIALGVLLLISIGVLIALLGALLFAGGIQQLGAEPGFRGRFLIAVAVVLASGAVALVGSQVLLPHAPRCWEVRAIEGVEVWRDVPIRGNPADSVDGGPAVQVICSSDTVTPVEAGIAAGSWLAAGAGLARWSHRRKMA